MESRRRREDDVMMPMMEEGMNPDVAARQGMMNKRHFPPGLLIFLLFFSIINFFALLFNTDIENIIVNSFLAVCRSR